MAAINVTGVVVKNNPCPVTDPFVFEISFECLYNLNEDLEWRVAYIGSGTGGGYSGQASTQDIELECIVLGPMTCGQLTFELQVNPPNHQLLPVDSILGMQAVIISACFRNNEFIRIGYYVNNDYVDRQLKENPPAVPQLDKILRYVITDSPRITRFSVVWEDTIEQIRSQHQGGDQGAKEETSSSSDANAKCSEGLNNDGCFESSSQPSSFVPDWISGQSSMSVGIPTQDMDVSMN